MHSEAPAIIAKDKDHVAGYCLAMPKSFKNDIPVLVPMFDIIDDLSFNDEPLRDIDYIVSGQVCVDKAYRGQGIFDGLYHQYREYYKDSHPCIITEILSVNRRSISAHQRVGFGILHRYSDPDDRQWDIVLWDWNTRLPNRYPVFILAGILYFYAGESLLSDTSKISRNILRIL